MLRPSGELCVHGCNSGTQRNYPIIVEKRRAANFVLSTTYLTVSCHRLGVFPTKVLVVYLCYTYLYSTLINKCLIEIF